MFQDSSRTFIREEGFDTSYTGIARDLSKTYRVASKCRKRLRIKLEERSPSWLTSLSDLLVLTPIHCPFYNLLIFMCLETKAIESEPSSN